MKRSKSKNWFFSPEPACWGRAKPAQTERREAGKPAAEQPTRHGERTGAAERGATYAHALRDCSMAPVTSVVGAFRRHVALSKSATLKMQMSLLLGARASRAAASTLSTAEVDSNVDRRPVEDVVVVGAGVAGGSEFRQ